MNMYESSDVYVVLSLTYSKIIGQLCGFRVIFCRNNMKGTIEAATLIYKHIIHLSPVTWSYGKCNDAPVGWRINNLSPWINQKDLLEAMRFWTASNFLV